MRIVPILLAIGLSVSPARTETGRALSFDGERYVKAFENGNTNERLVEFTRPDETVQTWRKLLAMHWYLRDGRKAVEAASTLARLAEQKSAGANAEVTEDPSTSEALVHFMVESPGSSTVEVNAFRYAPAPGGRGLVAVQFAFRFEAGKDPPETIKAARWRVVKEIRAFDMQQLRAYFRPGA